MSEVFDECAIILLTYAAKHTFEFGVVATLQTRISDHLSTFHGVAGMEEKKTRELKLKKKTYCADLDSY